MRRIFIIALVLILIALFWQLYQIYLQNRGLESNISINESKIQALDEENKYLQADLEYFVEPENLEKELRSRFNYKNPGEELIIIVPSKEE